MGKFRYLLLTSILGIIAITTSAFAYFNFSSNSSTEASATTDSDYVNNIKFDNNSTIDPDRTYTLYFFASPYYATGLESDPISSSTNALSDLTDPLEICTNEYITNPYNSSDPYCITSLTALSDSESEYANFYSTSSDSSSNTYRYISTPSYDYTTGDKLTTIRETYTKADFSGSLSVVDGISSYSNTEYDGDHTYFKMTVTGGIKADILNKITAETVYKNRYGFGPTFMGWTYDKQACFDRITYSTWKGSYQRYYNNATFGTMFNELKMTSVSLDSDGNVTINNDDVDQIGNFGSNSSISLLNADDSLYEIDNKKLDGTDSDDKIIYLYPVFGDQTISASTSDTKSPILKMLSNPDTNEDSSTYYKYHQEGEYISDYIPNDSNDYRKASYFNYDNSVTISTSSNVTKPNYTLKNFHVDQLKENNNYYLLEVLLTENNGFSYASNWVKLFDNSELVSLFKNKDEYFQAYVNTYEGTFDIDIIFSQTDFTFSKFENDELYINTPEKLTLKSSDDSTILGYYVIGLKRNNSFKITGLKNASIVDYSSQSQNEYLYKTSVVYNEDEDSSKSSTSSSDSSYWHYFTSNPIKLTKGKKISTIIKDALDLNDVYPLDDYKRMTSSVLSYYNKVLNNSDVLNKTLFVSPNKNAKLTATKEDITDSSGNLLASDFPTITCSEESTYEILIAVKYSNGFPKNIQVAYREYSEMCNLLVMSEKPTASSDNNYIYSDIITNNSSLLLLEGEFSIGETITKDTKFGDKKFSSILTSTAYKDKELYDLATNLPVKDLISNNNFILSRNMILYYN